MNSGRPYSMAVRGARAAETRERILECARRCFDIRSSGFTLEKVAAEAGVSVQTVLRAFGSKEGLALEAIGTGRYDVPDEADLPRSLHDAVGRIIDDYEEIGDRVIWMLAEEHRIAGFHAMAEVGRERHRAWVEVAFAEQLAGHRGARRREVMAALLVAVDVYTWKLLRRDMGLSRRDTAATVEHLVRGAVEPRGN